MRKTKKAPTHEFICVHCGCQARSEDIKEMQVWSPSGEKKFIAVRCVGCDVCSFFIEKEK